MGHCLAAILVVCAALLPAAWSAPITSRILIDGVDYSDRLQTTREGALYRVAGFIDARGFRIGVNTLVNPDPFVDYGLELINDDCPGGNCAQTPPAIQLVVTFDDGPWNGLFSTLHLFVRDANNNGSVSATGLQPGGYVMSSLVDGIPYHQLGNGCSFENVTPGFSSVCDSEALYSVIPQTGASGLLGLSILFSPSYGDAFSVRGTASLVPEPGTGLLALLALLPLGWRRRRH